MKVVIIGEGGREHALAMILAQAVSTEEVHVLPGKSLFSFEGLYSEKNYKKAAKKIHSYPDLKEQGQWIEKITELKKRGEDLIVIIGPEAPLENGIVDELENLGIKAIGPNKYAAQLETSKLFAKEIMKKYAIPTAEFKAMDSLEEGLADLKNWEGGVVIKAQGLAAGKGVFVAKDSKEAESMLKEAFKRREEKASGFDRIFLEKRLHGHEVSSFYLCREEEFCYLGSALDHKRLKDGDEGPNTGGMGCVSYNLPSSIKEKIEKKILTPLLSGMKEEGHAYRGILFLGLMIDQNRNPFVIEYNCRMGDPECQTLALLWSSDELLDLFVSFTSQEKKLPKHLSLKNGPSVHVVAASKGYGESAMLLGQEIKGLNHLSEFPDATLFVSGMELDGDQYFRNRGGRVFGLTCTGPNLEETRQRAYELISRLHFEGMQYRKDIGNPKRFPPNLEGLE